MRTHGPKIRDDVAAPARRRLRAGLTDTLTLGAALAATDHDAIIALCRRAAGPKKFGGDSHGRHHQARTAQDHRRGHQPALQLGPRICRRSAPWASTSRSASITAACTATASRRAQAGAGEVRARRAAGVRRQQHPLHHLDQDRRMGARQAFALGAADAQRPDPILWDFGSAAVHHKLYSPWLKPENCKAGLVGLRGTVASLVRPDEAPCRGDRLDPARSRRRQDADRRRHHRAADDVRTGEGRPEDRGRPAGHAGGARDQVAPTRSRCSTAPPRWSTAPTT